MNEITKRRKKEIKTERKT